MFRFVRFVQNVLTVLLIYVNLKEYKQIILILNLFLIGGRL